MKTHLPFAHLDTPPTLRNTKPKMSFARYFKSRPSAETIAALLAIGFGLVLRLRLLTLNLTFWLDEAMLGLNIVNRSFAGLINPLDYNQGAPLGFLWISKAAQMVLGDHDYVLRLFPFVASCASLFLLWLLARQLIKPFGMVFALLILASSRYLVSYGVQFKQYAVDVAITLLLYLLALSLLRKTCSKKDYLLLALFGSLSVWISHPAVFTLAGIGLLLMAVSVLKKDRPAVLSYVMVGFFWLVNFAALYLIQYRSLSANSYLTDFWSEYFMPVTISAPGWILMRLAGLFYNPGGFSDSIPAVLILLLFFAGALSLFWNEKRWIWMFALSMLFILAASSVNKYPFGGRMAMFAIPGMLICTGEGIELLRRLFARVPIVGWLSALLLAGFLLYNPLVYSVETAIKPKMAENIAGTLAYLKANYRDGDIIYLHHWSIPAFRYYDAKYGLENARVMNGTDLHAKRVAYQAEIAGLAGSKRAWFLFSHLTDIESSDDRDAIMKYANLIGVKKREFSEPGTLIKLYLYQLSP
jgi:hypothetical protein